MKKIIFVVVLFILLPLAFWGIEFFDNDISSNPSEWSNFGGFIGGTLSPLLAFISFIGLLATIESQKREIKRNKNHQEAKVYCEHAINTLERAYNTLSDSGKSKTPLQDRLVWLTTARLLLSAKKLYSKIPETEDSLKTLYIGEEEFWRVNFYKLLDPFNVNSFASSKAYFANPSETQGDEIEERSIKVIYNFVDWPDDRKDPMEEVPYYTPKEINKLSIGKLGLKSFLEQKHT
ncbi:MAG: hypothetical protein KAT04_14985 [Methylococcales bacterium]|nr:hypothetical protein [Methylococcales bacterium]